MKPIVKVRAITVEKSHYEKMSEENKALIFEPDHISTDFKIFSGQAAGICYMPDDYMSEGIQNEESALKRSGFNAKSGHYSVYEHAHITFDIQCSKAMAMVLNSTRLYATSEKSARYTKMKLSTIEQDIYNKWLDKFKNLIKIYFPTYKDSDVEKLAMENARYLTSVFTPTTMEFTVPYSRAIMIYLWLDRLASDIEFMKSKDEKFGNSMIYRLYYDPLADEAYELSYEIRLAIGDQYNTTLTDHKNIGIRFFSTINCLSNNYDINIETDINNRLDINEYYGDVYVSKYIASFASVAQIQRHRTCPVEIEPIIKDNITSCYIPNIIKDTPLENEWITDYTYLVENANIIPQATLLNVIERGLLCDFILKSKERLCARAQLETAEVVRDQAEKFADNYNNIADPRNREDINNMVNIDNTVKTRCKFTGYTCNEPCNRVKSNYNRII